MTRSRLEPFFLDSSAGRIFLLLRAPEGAKRCVLFVPPFGEEMNKTRRQFTATAQGLVDNGFAVLLVDLLGTGDSEGDFGDATWAIWKADVAATMDWIDNNSLSLDGIVAARLGCALAAESLTEVERHVPRSVFWQPVDSGRQFMTQFLRLRVAASMMEPDNRDTVESLKQRLLVGESLEIAGYTLTPELWQVIDGIELRVLLNVMSGDLSIVEVGRHQHGELSPAGKKLLATAAEKGIETAGVRVAGDPFWSATEIVVNPDVVRHTVEHFTRAPS